MQYTTAAKQILTLGNVVVSLWLPYVVERSLS
jgi:hypothetical protein